MTDPICPRDPRVRALLQERHRLRALLLDHGVDPDDTPDPSAAPTRLDH